MTLAKGVAPRTPWYKGWAPRDLAGCKRLPIVLVLVCCMGVHDADGCARGQSGQAVQRGPFQGHLFTPEN